MLKRMHIVILLYVIIVLLLFVFKPAMMFDNKGILKHFNYDETDTSGSLLNIEIVLCVLAIFCYFIVISLELMLSK